MPAKYDDTNRGTLFKNEKKNSEKSPDYEGRINVNGKDYRLSAWIKESKAGKKYMSLSVSSMAKVVPEGKLPDEPAPKFPEVNIKPLDLSKVPDDMELPF